MSAFIVPKEHIHYLLEAANSMQAGRFSWWSKQIVDRRRLGADCSYDQIGQMLWSENEKSFNARYNETDKTCYYEVHKETYLHVFEPVQVIKSVKCYQYQSCEHSEWNDSEAKVFTDTLIDAAIRRLSGYDDALWGSPEIQPETNVFCLSSLGK